MVLEFVVTAQLRVSVSGFRIGQGISSIEKRVPF